MSKKELSPDQLMRLRVQQMREESGKEWLELMINELAQINRRIRSKLVRDEKPRYNTYVRSLTSDLLIYLGLYDEILEVLMRDYVMRKVHVKEEES